MTKGFGKSDIEPLLNTAARLFAKRGNAREVGILAYATPEIQWYNRDFDVNQYRLYLQLPTQLFEQIEDVKGTCEQTLYEQIQQLMLPYIEDEITYVHIIPLLQEVENWREKALAWLVGEGVNNQGRVRSANVAPKQEDGLLFRSQPEINLYKALKARGVSFAPLPVFIQGGENYKRIEPDFVIVQSGIMMVVEVDGDTVHTESIVESHNRTTMLEYEGVHIEHVGANECDSQEKANKCAEKLLQIIGKLRSNK